MKKAIYIVKYSRGAWDDYEEVDVFVTESKSKAEKYRAKFNRILKKWKTHYSKYEDESLGWIKDEYEEHYFMRWYSLREVNGCYIKEIEQR